MYLASGNSGSSAGGNPQFILQDTSGNILFQVDTGGNVYIKGVLKGASIGGTDQPVNALAYNVNGYGPVIDATGTWKGKPIVSGASQSPWTGPINGAGFALSNAGTISGSQYFVNSSGNAVIDSSGTFRGANVDVGTGAIYGAYIATNQHGGANEIDTGLLKCSGAVNCGSVQINAATAIDSSRQVYGYQVFVGSGNSLAIDSGGGFHGTSMNVGANAVYCGFLATNQQSGGPNEVDTGTLRCSGTVYSGSASISGNMQANTANITGNFSANTVNLSFLQVNGNTLINNNYIWQGGVQCTNPSYGQIYGTEFGISNVSRGWPQSTGAASGATSTFATADGRHVTVCGGIITNVA